MSKALLHKKSSEAAPCKHAVRTLSHYNHLDSTFYACMLVESLPNSCALPVGIKRTRSRAEPAGMTWLLLVVVEENQLSR